MAENSYQSARKDAIRAAAAVGAGYLAYKGYKKVSSDWDADGCFEVAVAVVCLPSLVGTAALFTPYYLFWRARVYRNSERRLSKLEPALETLSRKLIARKKELEALPVKEHEIDEQLRPLQKQWERKWAQARREAALVQGFFKKQVEELARQRSILLEKSSSEKHEVLAGRLRSSERRADLLRQAGDELAEIYKVQAADSFLLFDEFVDQHRVPLTISFFLMFIPAIMFMESL